MVDTLNGLLESVANVIWSMPTVVGMLCIAVGLTVYFRGIQGWGFIHALQVVSGKYDKKADPGELSHFAALCTALSGTLGLGNISGVVVAICIGGPGATLWMMLAGLLGMAVKYAECSLACMYRTSGQQSPTVGGPMYYIGTLGRWGKPLACLFAGSCLCVGLGAANMFQANQVGAAMELSFGFPAWITGIVLAVLVGLVILGGIQRIGQVAQKVVPLMAGGFTLACLVVIGVFWERLPSALWEILQSAFAGHAAAGGFAGVAVKEVIGTGMRRALFSNEAGLGSAATAHSTARTSEPVREGFVALLEPFLDTVVSCTITAVVVVITGVWTAKEGKGVELAQAALDKGIPGLGTYFVPVAVFLFGFSTIIAWCYYGEQSTRFLFGEKAVGPFKAVYVSAVFLGTVWALGPIVNFSDIAMVGMYVPNIIAVLILAPRVKKETWAYWNKYGHGSTPVSCGLGETAPEGVRGDP